MAKAGKSKRYKDSSHTDFEPLITKLKQYADYWEARLDLPGIRVEHKYLDTFMDEQEDLRTAAQTITRWNYRIATIFWYLPSIIRMSDIELEMIVVHEYCHILNAPMDARMKANSEEVVELVTESMCRALILTRDLGA